MVPSKSRNTDVRDRSRSAGCDAGHRSTLPVIHRALGCESVPRSPRGPAHEQRRDVKTIQTVYEAFGRGDLPTILDAFTDDVDWASSVSSTEVPWWGVRHGKEEVTDFFVQLAGATGVLEFTTLRLLTCGSARSLRTSVLPSSPLLGARI